MMQIYPYENVRKSKLFFRGVTESASGTQSPKSFAPSETAATPPCGTMLAALTRQSWPRSKSPPGTWTRR